MENTTATVFRRMRLLRQWRRAWVAATGLRRREGLETEENGANGIIPVVVAIREQKPGGDSSSNTKRWLRRQERWFQYGVVAGQQQQKREVSGGARRCKGGFPPVVFVRTQENGERGGSSLQRWRRSEMGFPATANEMEEGERMNGGSI